MTEKTHSDQLPRCTRKYLRDDGVARRCKRGGHPRWVIGEFGRQLEVLCGPCESSVVDKGWKVAPLEKGEQQR